MLFSCSLSKSLALLSVRQNRTICRKRKWWGRSDLNTQPLGISNHAPELSHPPKGQHTQSCFWSPTSYLIRLRPQTANHIHTTDIKPLRALWPAPNWDSARPINPIGLNALIRIFWKISTLTTSVCSTAKYRSFST
jgi:hypothetical protein